MSIWTPEIIDHLRRLAGQALGSGAIARELAAMYGIRITRNAVIGKCLRAKIELRRPVKVTRPPRPRSEPRIHFRSPPKLQPLKLAPRCEPIIAEDDQGAPIDGGLTLVELRAGCCRWPFGDPLVPGLRYCGQPIAEGRFYSFCAVHMQRATTKSERQAA